MSNPCGKLPVTFAKADADLPHPQGSRDGVAAAAGTPGGRRGRMPPFDIDYTEGLKVGLQVVRRGGQGAAVRIRLRAFLHYLRVFWTQAGMESVSFTVRNTGMRAGAEIAQVYAGLPAAANEPPKRLVAWTKIQLAAGESKTVTLQMEPKLLSIFDVEKNDWRLLFGEYHFFVGGSSRNTPVTAAVAYRR